MNIIFETEGSSTALKTWMQAFSDIDDSLLVEIDLSKRLFIAKSFTADKTIVKYGQISFERCNIKVLSITTDDGKELTTEEFAAAYPGKRVYMGFLHNIKDVIEQIDFYSTEKTYKIIVRFSEVNCDRDGVLFVAHKVEFKSPDYNILAPVYNISEFNLSILNDDVFFNRVAAIPEPVTFELSEKTSAMLVKASSLHSKDAKRDIIKFVTSDENGWCLRAKDHTSGIYDCTLSHKVKDSTVQPIEIVAPITRQNFLFANKGDRGDSTTYITLSADREVQNGRLKIVSADGDFTSVVANVRI